MTNGYLFREYIGAQFTGVRFSDVPVNPGLSFNFILAFAIDYTQLGPTTSVPTNGVFTAFWDTDNLARADVAAVKAAHPNVSVMLGIGGDSVQDTVKVFFTPTSVDTWVANAVASLSCSSTSTASTASTSTTSTSRRRHLRRVHRPATHPAKGQVPQLHHLHRALRGRCRAGALHRALGQVLRRHRPRQLPVLRLRRQHRRRRIRDVQRQAGGELPGREGAGQLGDRRDHRGEQAAHAGARYQRRPELLRQNKLPAQPFACSGKENKLPGFFIFSADSSKKSIYGFEYETRVQEIVANH